VSVGAGVFVGTGASVGKGVFVNAGVSVEAKVFVGVGVWVRVGVVVGALVGMSVGVLVLVGVNVAVDSSAVGAVAACSPGLHPAKSPVTATILRKSRLEIPGKRALSLRFCIFPIVVSLYFCMILP
jgi:hypothetical protein